MDFPVIWLSLTVDMPRWYFTSPDPWGGRREGGKEGGGRREEGRRDGTQVTTNEAKKQKWHHVHHLTEQCSQTVTVATYNHVLRIYQCIKPAHLGTPSHPPHTLIHTSHTHTLTHLVLRLKLRIKLTEKLLQRFPSYIRQHIQTTAAIRTHNLVHNSVTETERRQTGRLGRGDRLGDWGEETDWETGERRQTGRLRREDRLGDWREGIQAMYRYICGLGMRLGSKVEPHRWGMPMTKLSTPKTLDLSMTCFIAGMSTCRKNVVS